jgi:hypothetical protein
MTQEKEAFLDRWSRLKKEQAKEVLPEEKRPEAPMPVLPPVEELKPESDFRPFMDPRVDAETRRGALKKLFEDARFNVPDPFEAYSEDYTVGEPIPEEMLRTLNQAKKLLFDEPKTAAEATEPGADADAAAAQPETETKDVAGRQDA